MLMLSMLVFGSVGLFIRYIPLPASVIAFSRALFGGLFLCLVAALRHIHLSRKAIAANLPYLLTSGIIMGWNWIFLFRAMQTTTVAVAIICYYLAPVFVVLLSPLVLKERITAAQFGAVLMALCGMVLVSGLLEQQGSVPITGIGYGIAAAVFYAGVILCNKKFRGLSAYESTIVQLAAAALVLVPYILLTEDLTRLSCTPFQLALLMILSLVVTGLTYAMFFGSLPYLSGQTIAVYTYIDPITAVLLSALVLKEPLTLSVLLGAILILGATLIVEFSGRKT